MDEKKIDEKYLEKRVEDLKDLIRKYKGLRIILRRIMIRLKIDDNQFKTTFRNDNSLRLQDINELSPNTYTSYFSYLVAEKFLVRYGIKTVYNVSQALIYFFVKYPDWLEEGFDNSKKILNISDYEWDTKKLNKGKNKK